MKKCLFVLAACMTSLSFTSAQNLHCPEWIVGSWKNSLVSDTRRFISWKFDQHQIYVGYGLVSDQNPMKHLGQDYPGYKLSETSSDSLYQVTLSKETETVVYTFKRTKDAIIKEPIFTYALTINGITKANNPTSAYVRFIKE
jgi:hypothetical protein